MIKSKKYIRNNGRRRWKDKKKKYIRNNRRRWKDDKNKEIQKE